MNVIANGQLIDVYQNFAWCIPYGKREMADEKEDSTQLSLHISSLQSFLPAKGVLAKVAPVQNDF